MCSLKISDVNQVDLNKTSNKKVISEQKQETKTVKNGKKFILAGLAAAFALGIATVLILKNKAETVVDDIMNGKIRSMRDNFDKIKVQHSEQALSRRELGCRDVTAVINGKDFGFGIENPPFRSLK